MKWSAVSEWWGKRSRKARIAAVTGFVLLVITIAGSISPSRDNGGHENANAAAQQHPSSAELAAARRAKARAVARARVRAAKIKRAEIRARKAAAARAAAARAVAARAAAARRAAAAAKAAAAKRCNPNYSGCLDPNAYDYDCVGGSGNGPLYTGTVKVLGYDEYGLDADGDGWGCE